ncbi:MAG: hypothetical protein GX589_08750, partial [Deltaproteobacteria bacterium]|nr:hypothetical protein [Deltaproteobacteria bacterium]
MKIVSFVVAILFLILVPGSDCSAQEFARAKKPRGEDLPANYLYTNGKVRCGFINDQWIPGKILKNGRFLSLKAQRRTLNKQLKKQGSSGSVLAKRIARLTKRIRREKKICEKATKRLRFNLSNAVGLALVDANSQSLGWGGPRANVFGSSNLRTVLADGRTQEALESGKAKISQFLIAPNKKLYVIFETPINLEDTDDQESEGRCLLGEVNTVTGVPVCIDGELTQVGMHSDELINSVVQFDGAGAIYYPGVNTESKTVLRRNSRGVITDLINDSIELHDFLVLRNGTVLVYGGTASSNMRWLRRINANGGIKDLIIEDMYLEFLQHFPDGNAYVGLESSNNNICDVGEDVIVPYSTTSDTLDCTRAIRGIIRTLTPI